MTDVLQQLTATLKQRKNADPGESYVAALHQQGLNKILEKVGEEATEGDARPDEVPPGDLDTIPFQAVTGLFSALAY